MQHSSILRLGDLLGCELLTPAGKHLGRVADIELSLGPEYRVIALIYGRRGLLYRLHVLNPFRRPAREKAPDKIAWEALERIEGSVIIVTPL